MSEFVPVVLPAPAEAAEETSSPCKKVLVVDDDPVVVKALTLTLHAKGYKVLSALDGAEAISIIRDKNPDVLLVDVGLPPDIASGGAVLSDGFQVTRWLQLANAKKIPTIIISGSDRAEYKRKAAALGADGFMAKPINKDLLFDSIEAALSRPSVVGNGFEAMRMAE
ncbi:MAG TPA: response regulator [Candidatus Angelobacter sp.]|nr:response regulator [Candidatus Angelobacter sp.]